MTPSRRIPSGFQRRSWAVQEPQVLDGVDRQRRAHQHPRQIDVGPTPGPELPLDDLDHQPDASDRIRPNPTLGHPPSTHASSSAKWKYSIVHPNRGM